MISFVIIMAETQGEDLLDTENQYRVESLTHKVSRLKSLVVDIESETKDHHMLLNGLGSEFEAGQSLLSNSFGRLRKMSSRHSNRQAMCYVTIVLLAAFFIIYYGVAFFKR
ncbi:hypothetical protein J437_LFUL014191 [Ladona fulva]|uniref:t-SNARE coiled-coil homology domain-containing protein n=1 Tax=Ladona fulva TaxID=123851 RepID=A0A8K0KGF6_LADFU|nr:hypothetical protein J437_LFUL014191 [Ladona fulva]